MKFFDRIAGLFVGPPEASCSVCDVPQFIEELGRHGMCRSCAMEFGAALPLKDGVMPDLDHPAIECWHI